MRSSSASKRCCANHADAWKLEVIGQRVSRGEGLSARRRLGLRPENHASGACLTMPGFAGVGRTPCADQGRPAGLAAAPVAKPCERGWGRLRRDFRTRPRDRDGQPAASVPKNRLQASPSAEVRLSSQAPRSTSSSNRSLTDLRITPTGSASALRTSARPRRSFGGGGAPRR